MTGYVLTYCHNQCRHLSILLVLDFLCYFYDCFFSHYSQGSWPNILRGFLGICDYLDMWLGHASNQRATDIVCKLPIGDTDPGTATWKVVEETKAQERQYSTTAAVLRPLLLLPGELLQGTTGIPCISSVGSSNTIRGIAALKKAQLASTVLTWDFNIHLVSYLSQSTFYFI